MKIFKADSTWNSYTSKHCCQQIGFCIGSFIRRKISNASIEFLEEMKPETDQIKNYLMETIHIDHSDPAIIEKTKEVIAPIDEALQKNYSEYLDGISLFQEQYAPISNE